MRYTTLIPILSLVFFYSCSDQNFSSVTGKDKKVKSKSDDPVGDQEPAGDDPTLTLKTKTTSFNNEVPPPKLVDYVLVIDNSNSMTQALANAKAGIQATIAKKVFNDEARISMISSMPARFDDTQIFKEVHPAVNAHVGASVEPGFMSFARAEQLKAFTAENETEALDKYTLPFCELGSFSPYQKHEEGHYCVDAILQTVFRGVGVEDGILSFYQTVKLADKTPIFRKGAEVNVIFISDVHAPGIKTTYRPEDSANLFLPANRPNYEKFLTAVKEANDITKLTFHSITPSAVVAGCTEGATEFGIDKSKLDLTYHTLVAESQGSNQEICADETYEEFFNKMVTEAQTQTSLEVVLDEKASSIESVKVNDLDFTEFTFDAEKNSVKIDLSNLEKKNLKIDVEFFTAIEAEAEVIE